MNWLRQGMLTAFVFVGCVFAGIAAPAAQQLQLGAPFCDNAVLQRGMDVPVWGWSTAGDTITVTFAGQSKTAKAGADGKWMVRLDALDASFDPREMIISSAKHKSKTTIKNVLVGEVWMASGQSNMQWKAGKCNAIDLQVEAVDGVNPIREFEVTSCTAQLHPIEKATGAWKDGNYAEQSAIAFAFAHKLYGELNVPIGILNCSWSQTAIQAWVSRDGYATGEDAYTRGIHEKCLKTDPTTPEHDAAWTAFYTSLEDQIEANQARIKRGEKAREVDAPVPGNMHGNRDANWLFSGRLNPVVPYAIQGAIWNQGYANMGEGLPYYNNLHSLVRGWRIAWDEPELPVYFHQFYCAGNGDVAGPPSIGSTAEMRLGTWMARDIPNAGMASQIDVQGAIHYRHKSVPGQRLALHALKNQYGKKVAADGPMFKSYTVKGNTVTIDFENAEGGLVVADTGYNAIGKSEDATGFADPKVIENGDDQVKLFWLAGADRVWHPAECRVKGDTVIVTADGVKSPRGVSYATGGVGFVPNLYNRALLPMTPFIYYDNELVTSETWPDEKLKIAGETIDPSTVGLLYEWRKMPILSVQFRDNAVLQADKPVTIWGSTQNFGEWGGPAEGVGIIHFEFAPRQGSEQDSIKKTIPVTEGMDEWEVTLPPMKGGPEPYTLKVSFTLDGELAHERTATNIVFGDVWYVAAPAGKFKVPAVKPSGGIVRVIENESKRDGSPRPSRYSVCVSRTPLNRFASYWKAPSGLTAALGHSLAARTGRPVGIIFMQSKPGKGQSNPPLKNWIGPDFLKEAPSLMEDYETVGSQYPNNPYYNANIRRYIADWKSYWGDYIPEMMRTKAVPDGKSWGWYPSPTPKVGDSQATQTYNIYVYPFTPAALRGVIFLSSESMVKDDQGAQFGPEMAALANCFKAEFGNDPVVVYSIPNASLAPKITKPEGIKGKAEGVEISDWSNLAPVIERAEKVAK